MSYRERLQKYLLGKEPGEPVYLEEMGALLEQEFNLSPKKAKAAAATTLKRMIDKESSVNLRRWTHGVYYRTEAHPLIGEIGIDAWKVFCHRYLDGGKGYETGAGLLNNLGLSTWLPARREFVSNELRVRPSDPELFPSFRVIPPKVQVNEGNRDALQILDAIMGMNDLHVDCPSPSAVIANAIDERHLSYAELMHLSGLYYPPEVSAFLGNVACERLDMRNEAA